MIDYTEARFVDIDTLIYTPMQRLVIAVFFIVNFGGMLGNGFMMYLFAKDRKLQSPAVRIFSKYSTNEKKISLLTPIFLSLFRPT